MPNGVRRIVLFPVRAGMPKRPSSSNGSDATSEVTAPSIETSTNWPSPVASRTRSAARIPISPNSGETRSANGMPILTGGSPSSPESIMIPESAWITVSYALSSPAGPSAPKPLIAQ